MKVAIVGHSGHSLGVVESIKGNNFEVFGYFDNCEKESSQKLTYLGKENELVFGYNLFITIGDNTIRESVFERVKERNNLNFNIFDKTSNISALTRIGIQTYLAKNTVINADVTIGIGCIINTSCVVEHGCRIGNFTHLAPSATICGNVTIGNNCFVGANSTIIPGIEIGDNVTIGAGSVVNRNLESNYTYVGNPIRKL